MVLHREFGPGEVPALGLVDESGRALPDGVYGYELRPVAPVAGFRNEATAAEPSRFLSGYLSVRDGGFVVPPTSQDILSQRSESGSGASSPAPIPADLVLDEELIVDDSACDACD